MPERKSPARRRARPTSQKAEPYRCPELAPNPGLPESRLRAFSLPSRVGGLLYYPDGRVEEVNPKEKRNAG